MKQPKNHRFISRPKGGRKGNRGQTKMVRKGSRNPGATGIGSNRHPY